MKVNSNQMKLIIYIIYHLYQTYSCIDGIIFKGTIKENLIEQDKEVVWLLSALMGSFLKQQ